MGAFGFYPTMNMGFIIFENKNEKPNHKLLKNSYACRFDTAILNP